MKNNSFTFALLAVVILLGCARETLFESYIPIPRSGWHQDSIIEVDVIITDTSLMYRVVTGIRHTPDYPFRNFYLFREIESERGMEFRDTAMFLVSDITGKRQGSGIGHVRDLYLTLGRAPIKFGRTGPYTFRFSQAMRPESIKGIQDFYVKIEPVTTEQR